MCNNVVIHSYKLDIPDRIASNQEELANIIGLENVIMDEGGVTPSGAMYEDAVFCDTDCLCPVNLEATSKAAGYNQSRLDNENKHDPFDYHWRKQEQPSNKSSTKED